MVSPTGPLCSAVALVRFIGLVFVSEDIGRGIVFQPAQIDATSADDESRERTG